MSTDKSKLCTGVFPTKNAAFFLRKEYLVLSVNSMMSENKNRNNTFKARLSYTSPDDPLYKRLIMGALEYAGGPLIVIANHTKIPDVV